MDTESATHAHNLFLQTGVDLGVPGILAYWLFVAAIIVQAVQALHRFTRMNGNKFPPKMPDQSGSKFLANNPLVDLSASRSVRKRRKNFKKLSSYHSAQGLSSQQPLFHLVLAQGALGSIVGMLVHGLLDAVTWGTKLSFIPWLIFALVTTIYQENAQHTTTNSTVRQQEAEINLQWSTLANPRI